MTNGEETDIDCGGSLCPKCWPGKLCQNDSDCRSGTCSAGKCLDPFVANAKITTGGYLWKIAVGTTELSVQPNGGKVNAFTLGGTNALVISDAATGAITWIAPQSDWSETGWQGPGAVQARLAGLPAHHPRGHGAPGIPHQRGHRLPVLKKVL